MAADPIESLELRTRLLVIFLVISIVVALASVASDLMQQSLLDDLAGGMDVSMDDAERNDFRQMVVGMGALVVLLVTGVTYCLWIYRAYENLRVIGAPRKYSTAWAVGCHFVPLVNFFRPYTIMKEIWNGSDPVAADPDQELFMKEDSTMVLAWWLLFLVARFTQRATFSSDDTTLSMVAAAFEIASAAVLIMIVRRIADGQAQRWEDRQQEQDDDLLFAT
jgi:hypothetical protein